MRKNIKYPILDIYYDLIKINTTNVIFLKDVTEEKLILSGSYEVTMGQSRMTTVEVSIRKLDLVEENDYSIEYHSHEETIKEKITKEEYQSAMAVGLKLHEEKGLLYRIHSKVKEKNTIQPKENSFVL